MRAHLRETLVGFVVAFALALGVLVPSVATAAPTAAPLSFGYIGTSKHACTNPGQGQAACTALIRTDAAVRNARPAARGKSVKPDELGNNGAYDPSYLQSAYNLTSLSQSAGDGETVAIVDAYDDPNIANDLSSYRSYFGLPACTSGNGCFRKVNQSGGTSSYPAGNSNWAVEISLDVDMVSAICPNCDILLVEANSASFNNLLTAVDTAVRSGAKYVSMSWAGSDSSGETSYDSHFDKPGIVFTAASGDSGYGAEYPAASPYVTSVGGTTLNQLTNTGTRDATETVWSGTGSGCSKYELQPSWQSGTGSACVKNGTAYRSENDVAAVADPNTGVWVYDTYGQTGLIAVGGTSAATPIIASVYALAGQPGANTMAASYPYGDPSALNDITSGSNGSCTVSYMCNARVGYDGPTGLGTPNGVDAFQPSAPTTGLISGTVTDSVTHSGVANATVSWNGSSTTTNSSGAYTLGNLTPGTFNLTVSATNYAPATAFSVSVTAGNTTPESVSLTPNLGTVNVTVTDSSSNPITNATVTLGSATPSSTSGDVYTFTSVQEGSYTLTVSASGYQTATPTVNVGPGATVNTTVTLSTVPGTITGKVTDSSTSAGIVGATVTVNGTGLSTTTGSGGSYTINSVPAGSYTVSASASNYQSNSVSNVTVSSGSTTSNVNIALTQVVTPPTGTVAGRVTLSFFGGNYAISGATVTVTMGSQTYTGTTNSSGNYSISGVPAGAGTVSVRDGYGSQTKNVTVTGGNTATVNFSQSFSFGRFS